MNTADHHLWLLVLGAILATYLWRFLGVLFSRRINPEGAAFQWVTCVSYAMLAALISRMILIPVGPLVEVSLWIRLVSLIVGLAVFFLVKKQVLIGVGAGLSVFTILIYE